jgi:hypothetical protein
LKSLAKHGLARIMKVEFESTNKEALESRYLSEVKTILDGAWSSASDLFSARNHVRKEQNRTLKVGKQSDLNDVLQARFEENLWRGSDGRFFKDSIWIRFSFRHSMSLGSDFLEAFRVHKIEGFQVMCLMYADENLLEKIWPSGGQALCSFEKSSAYWSQLNSVLDMPLVIGRLYS